MFNEGRVGITNDSGKNLPDHGKVVASQDWEAKADSNQTEEMREKTYSRKADERIAELAKYIDDWESGRNVLAALEALSPEAFQSLIDDLRSEGIGLGAIRSVGSEQYNNVADLIDTYATADKETRQGIAEQINKLSDG